MFNAIVKDDLLSKEDCQYLVDTVIALDLWESAGHKFWDNRITNYYSILQHDKRAAEIMLDANIKCGNIIRNNYAIPEVYSDTLQVVRWFPGMEQPPHADDMTNTDVTGLEHRAFGSIVYLNDNYNGGNTYYPNFDISITPKAGTLAIHPGDPEHLHGVTKIEDGMRYTIASFWTLNKYKGHDWLKEI
jgi:hypothetical protein